MKKSTKRTLLAALIIFSVGVLLSTVSFIVALTTETDIYNDASHVYDFSSFSLSFDEVKERAHAGEASNFSELLLSFNDAELEIRKTDGVTQFEFYNVDQNNLEFSYVAGTLKLCQPQKNNRLGFYVGGGDISFGGLRHFFHGASTRTSPKLVIHWNPSDSLASVRIDLTAGAVLVDELPQNTALFADLSVGNISVSNCNSPNRAMDLHTGVGSIDSTNNRFETANFSNTTGNITLVDTFANTTATSTVGILTFRLDQSIQRIRAQATTTFGSVHLPSGEHGGNQYNWNVAESEFTARITTTVGDIYLEEIEQ